MSEQLVTYRKTMIPDQLDLLVSLELRYLGPPDESCLHPAAALRFLMGGNAIFTLLNLAGGSRQTLRVREKKGRVYCHRMNGPDNLADYLLVGSYEGWKFQPRGDAHELRGRMHEEVEAGEKIFRWLGRLWRPGFTHWPETVRFMHAGRCCRCGRVLTVPESIASGIGPECSRRRDSLTKPGDPLHGLV